MAKLERTEKPISVIIEERKVGDLGLPEIQRGYVWKQTQVRDLLESMYKEYPCGLVLYWKPSYELLNNLKIKETDSLPNSHQGLKLAKPSFLILDGQQRIMSIIKVLEGSIDVHFNVEEEKFEIKSRKIKGNPLWISITRIWERGATEAWLELTGKLKIEDKQKANEYLKRLTKIEKIKDYRLPVEIMYTDDYEEITEAFIRLNSRGTKLREAELALAKLALMLPGMISDEFEDFLDTLEEKNFNFEARFLIRCLVAVATGQSRFKHLSRLWKLDDEEITNIWKCAKKGIEDTISFLRSNIGIESTDWIPSINALVPLVVFFSKNSHLSDMQEKKLLFWFYSATIWGRYSSSAETKLDQDLDVMIDKQAGTLKDNAIDSMIINCRRDVPDFIVDEDELKETYQLSSFMPVLFALIRKRRSKDWFNGIELSATNVGPDNKIELHHFFPRSVLKNSNMPRDLYDDLANIVFLSKKANREIRQSLPIDYIKKNKVPDDRLTEQFIPLDEALWRLDNYEKFLEVRRNMLASALNGFLKDLAADYMVR